ncbi:unnamed protein product [Gulo gulo]|uniref:Uncharacterized protein n=1 Tax=Gulo gulo TaxID=48420 RepID=A0A9X9MCE8_GULGU|nr:unnamed protein product [Gulo gulo]
MSLLCLISSKGLHLMENGICVMAHKALLGLRLLSLTLSHIFDSSLAVLCLEHTQLVRTCLLFFRVRTFSSMSFAGPAPPHSSDHPSVTGPARSSLTVCPRRVAPSPQSCFLAQPIAGRLACCRGRLDCRFVKNWDLSVFLVTVSLELRMVPGTWE